MKIVNTKVNYISGPVSFDFYKIKGKDLLIFGDKHDEIEGMCNPCSYLDENSPKPRIIRESGDCYTLSSLIENILEYMKGKDMYLDVYVESFYSIFQKLKNNNTEYLNLDTVDDGRLSGLIKFYGNCKTCKNIRFHHIDMRNIMTSREISIYRVIDELFIKKTFERFTKLQNTEISNVEIFLEDINDLIIYVNFFCIEIFPIYKDIITKFMMICATSKDFIVDCENYISDLIEMLPNLPVSDDDFLEKEIITFFNPLIEDIKEHLHIVKNYDGMILHPIGKQFRKLIKQEGRNEFDIKDMVEFLLNEDEKMWDDELNERLEILRLNYDNISQLILENSSEENMNEYVPVIFDNIYSVLDLMEEYNIMGTSFIMDIYAIPRILYDFEKSKMKIVSVGLFHAKKFSEFIDYFYPGSNASKMNMLSSKNETKNDRCLDMKKITLK